MGDHPTSSNLDSASTSNKRSLGLTSESTPKRSRAEHSDEKLIISDFQNASAEVARFETFVFYKVM